MTARYVTTTDRPTDNKMQEDEEYNPTRQETNHFFPSIKIHFII